MDFASILGSEIKKRKSAATATTSSTDSSTSGPPPKKYLKRAEIEAAREAEYRAEQARIERERAEKAEKRRLAEIEEEKQREALLEKKRKLAEESKRKREEAEAAKLAAANAKSKKALEGATATATGKEGGSGDEKTGAEESSKEGGDSPPQLSDEEVIARLRELQHPAKLFGETPTQRLRRLRRVDGSENSSTTTSTSTSKSKQNPKLPDLTEAEMMLDPKDITGNPSKVYHQLHSWFLLVLREWDIALTSRPQSVKTSYQGISATSSYTQAQQYMAPLFRHLQKQDLHPDIFPKVCEIVHQAQKRNYVNANHVYLELSIGNAAWPIGVTMVGIHERSAREKLHEKGMAAHIMSDEVTRKYLQSIKRCLRFCQTRWPPEDQLQIMG